MKSIYDMSEDEYRGFLGGRTLGGTAAGAIIGVNKYKTAAQLWDDLMGDGRSRARNQHMDRGNALEPMALQMFAEKTGLTLEPLGKVRHPKYEFLHGSVDVGIVPDGLVEAKCPQAYIARQYVEEGIDPGYWAQAQHYLNVTGRRYAKFAILNADQWELYVIDCPRDQDFIDQMEAKMISFWYDHVLTRQRPSDIQNVEDMLVPVIPGSAIERLDDEWVTALVKLKAAREFAATAEHKLKLAKDTVQQLMGSTELVITPGWGKISYKEGTSTSLTQDRFKAQRPISRELFMAWATEKMELSRERAEQVADELVANLRDFQNITTSRRFDPRFES